MGQENGKEALHCSIPSLLSAVAVLPFAYNVLGGFDCRTRRRATASATWT